MLNANDGLSNANKMTISMIADRLYCHVLCNKRVM